MDTKEIYEQVHKRYGSVTKTTTGNYEQTVAKAFGYTEEELAGIPEGANLGLSCGNPTALAKLREGETVIDLGSGAGFDVLTAANKIGPAGKAIGIDMNKNMIDKANTNRTAMNLSNVEFVEGTITSVPFDDAIADCIISNCVVNLVPALEKQLVFNEMFRLLKPGGRVAISDILARREFNDEIRNNIALYVGCISGASPVKDYETFLENAGFKAHENEQTDSACGISSSTCIPLNSSKELGNGQDVLGDHLGINDFNEWAGSFQIYAVKPVSS
ncbi:sam-dependent methyltransferase coq5 family [Fusarium sporotrichioides]|uniref:Arsenite methyltransferase n=1 Tax=Fusarium sporotrichioides TaxID=5514 RepID=A0A395SHS4_FUSSP|nr:sam-dependent methyltransferase coq5 family [Fusarium sporotrichioides]